MKSRLARITAALSLLVLTGAAVAQQTVSPTSGDKWLPPACNLIEGASTVTFTRNDGQTLALTPPPTGMFYTTGLAALETPNTLVASTNGVLLRSTDAGCTWTVMADPREETGHGLLQLTKAGGDRVYGWADNGSAFVRIDGTKVAVIKAPALNIMGVGVDPADPDRVRLGDNNGQIWESTDAGQTWFALGAPAAEGLLVYRVAFDPTDPGHILVGTMIRGAFVSTDAARSWTPAAGFTVGQEANVFNFVVSPVDPQVVWAMGIDLSLVDTDAKAARAIYRSTDGGFTFSPAVRGSQANMQNGPTMAAHPTDPGVLYWAFGMSFNNYGTDLYRYDAAADHLTSSHNAYHGIGAIEFSPALPEIVLYLGPELIVRRQP